MYRMTAAGGSPQALLFAGCVVRLPPWRLVSMRVGFQDCAVMRNESRLRRHMRLQPQGHRGPCITCESCMSVRRLLTLVTRKCCNDDD